MTETKRVTLIPGDGIGPEVVGAAKKIVEAAGAAIAWEECAAGASVFKQGVASGVTPETIESIRKTRVVLKGPLETPVGYGNQSANVTLRKLFETYGNIRPVKELAGVPTPYSGRGVDLVIVRENVEDLYAGIEYMQTPGVAEGLKLISRKGCEKIARLAFEFARSEGRTRVHCATKANIMKLTEGLLKKVFEEVSKEYPDIQAQHIIVDNCAHQLVKKPEQFEVIVTTNMNGDILSDLSSALIGGLGFAPSANLGNEVAIFEAVHGSAPKYAGKNIANPTAIILSAVLMLRYLQQFDVAAKIENAVLFTIQEGKVSTRDVVGDEKGATIPAFTDAIIKNLGKKPSQSKERHYKPIVLPQLSSSPDFVKVKSRRVIGMDLFVESGHSAEELGKALTTLSEGTPFVLKMISNRGTQLYPSSGAITDTVDHWRCRFMSREEGKDLPTQAFWELINKIEKQFTWMHVEKLLQFDEERGFTKAQGEN